MTSFPNNVYTIPECANTVMAKPEVHHGCRRETGASQNVCPQCHSADMTQGDCSRSRSWVSGGVAGLAAHSCCTATKTVTTSNMAYAHVNPINVLSVLK